MTTEANHLIETFSKKLDKFPSVGLINSPTPLQFLPKLSAKLGGPDIWLKRDDATHISSGGNKLRKLDRVLGQALSRGCDTLVSGGVAQSNSQRQVATAAAMLGLDAHLVVYEGRVPPPSDSYDISGNVLLNKLFGAHMHRLPWKGDRNLEFEKLAERLRSEGKKPYVIPYGVSNDLGALSYSTVVLEIAQQALQYNFSPAAIIAASGSGGTQAGLMIGAQLCLPGASVIGVDVDAEPERIKIDVLNYATGGAALIGGAIDPGKFEIASGYSGTAYGVVHETTLEAIRLAASIEAVILDPVYSGKALAGLIGMIENGRFAKSDSVVLVHTGGLPSIFTYAEVF